MSKNIILILALTTLTASCIVVIQPVKADVIYIETDGSILETDDIQKIGDTYIFKNNIKGSIFVRKDNITIDGAGYSLQGSGSEKGIFLMFKNGSFGYGGVTIKNLQIDGFGTGIDFVASSGNTISRCNFTNCKHSGISILSSSNNTFSDNYFYNNYGGILLEYSPNNILTGNRFEGNSKPLLILEGWVNFIDFSNTINGKPIYYFVNQKDLLINSVAYPEIGYLAFVDCTRIIIKDWKCSDSGMGIIMVQTTDSTITHNNISNKLRGIYLYSSNNTNIAENQLANNDYGIFIEGNSANTIAGNTIINNRCGIYFSGTVPTQIIYHNNFINNSKNADANSWITSPYAPFLPQGMFIWDNGYPFGGNHWSDYNGIDSNHDGIGDTPYVVSQYLDNTDRYPLIEPVAVISEFPDDAGETEPFPTLSAIAVTVTVVALVAVGLLVYFKKRKR